MGSHHCHHCPATSSVLWKVCSDSQEQTGLSVGRYDSRHRRGKHCPLCGDGKPRWVEGGTSRGHQLLVSNDTRKGRAGPGSCIGRAMQAEQTDGSHVLSRVPRGHCWPARSRGQFDGKLPVDSAGTQPALDPKPFLPPIQGKAFQKTKVKGFQGAVARGHHSL